MGVILFDFFGTLVDYDPSRTAQGYARTHALLTEVGAEIGYVDFLMRWDAASARFDAACDEDDHEFSMTEVGTAFLRDVLGRSPIAADVDALVATYLDEWNQGVRSIDGVPAMLRGLREHHRLAIVTNTHDRTLVPGHLATMGITDCFDAVVTSVEVGWRKPHPRIYQATLDILQVGPGDCTFVGDTRGPDYIGPRSMGMRALLIDPRHQQAIPAEDRIASVLDVRGKL